MKYTRVCVAGGAGYVGSVLVPQLLQKGYHVRVFDSLIYGRDPLEGVLQHPNFELLAGDIRDKNAVEKALEGIEACIHLACISNDPSVELSPDLSQSVNYDSFEPFVLAAKKHKVQRFIFASSGSVYGISDSPDVSEEHPLVPVSLYNKFKMMCEPVLLEQTDSDFTTTIIRPATICGYSPRQRLDLTVNILTNHAVNAGKIRVFGGSQMRPNLHMQDMVDLYLLLLETDKGKIEGQIFNAAYQNYSVSETAEIVQRQMQKLKGGSLIPIEVSPSDDLRSYHLSSEKISRVLGFRPRFRIEDAIEQLVRAFDQGKLPNSMSDSKYFNVKWMKEIAFA